MSPPVRLSDIIQTAFGIDLTPVQLALCAASDGRPMGDLWGRQDVRDTFAGVRPEEVRPLYMAVCAAIRTGKSILVSGMALSSATSCDQSRLVPGESARVPVLATSTDQAGVVFGFCVEGARKLGCLAEPPKRDSLWVEHIDSKQRPVEIKVTAGSRGGANIVARWLAGVVFDEFTLMTGAEDGVINLDDAIRQTKNRLLPGAQVGLVGSPHAPEGPGYRMVTENFGKPTRRLVVAWGIGPEMAPVNYPPAAVEELRQNDPDVYAITCRRQFLDPETSYFEASLVDACSTLTGPVPPASGHQYTAAMDPATRTNAWTLVVMGSPEAGRYQVVLHRQWIPEKGHPLSPRAVFGEIAQLLGPYGTSELLTDQHHFESLFDLAAEHGLNLVLNGYDPLTAFPKLHKHLAEGSIDLPKDDYVRRDLIGVKRRPTSKSVIYRLATTRGDGRHSDYVPSLLHALSRPPPPPVHEVLLTEEQEQEQAMMAAATAPQDWLQAAFEGMTA